MRRYDTVGATPGEASAFYDYTYSQEGHGLDFDPVHKLVFVARGVTPTDNSKVFRYDDKLANQLLLTTLGSDRPVTITSDSDNQIAYFLSVDNPHTTTSLHSVNHDGSGYAAIGAITNVALQPRTPIHYCRANGKLYYCSESPQELYRIDVDGTNDTLIAGNSQVNSQIRDCTVDNDGQYLYWVDDGYNNGTTSRIYRSDLDGGGVTLLLTGTAISVGEQVRYWGPQWSHKNQRLYYFQQDEALGISSDTANGLFSMKFDGSGIKFHIPRGNGTDWWRFGTGTVIYDWRLGCGYETTGAASTA
jgi:hypothetical protein